MKVGDVTGCCSAYYSTAPKQMPPEPMNRKAASYSSQKPAAMSDCTSCTPGGWMLCWTPCCSHCCAPGWCTPCPCCWFACRRCCLTAITWCQYGDETCMAHSPFVSFYPDTVSSNTYRVRGFRVYLGFRVESVVVHSHTFWQRTKAGPSALCSIRQGTTLHEHLEHETKFRPKPPRSLIFKAPLTAFVEGLKPNKYARDSS